MCQLIMRKVRNDEECVSLISSLGYNTLKEWLSAGAPVVSADAQLESAALRLQRHVSKLKGFDDYLQTCGNVLTRLKGKKISCSIDAFMHPLDALEVLDARIRSVMQLAARHEREPQTSRETRNFAFLCIAFLSKKFVQCHKILTLAGNFEQKQRANATKNLCDVYANHMRRFERHVQEVREVVHDSTYLQTEQTSDGWHFAFRKINNVRPNSSLKPFVDLIKCCTIRLQAHIRVDVGEGPRPLSKICPRFYELSKSKEDVQVALKFTQLSILGDVDLISIQVAEQIMSSHRFEHRQSLNVKIVDPTRRISDGTTIPDMYEDSFVYDVSCGWTSDGSSYNMNKFLLRSARCPSKKTTPKFSVVVSPQGARETIMGRTEEFVIKASCETG